MLVHCRVTPSIKFAGTHLYTWAERCTVRVKCLAQEHNAMSPARARTRTARSGDERTNHEAVASDWFAFNYNCRMIVSRTTYLVGSHSEERPEAPLYFPWDYIVLPLSGHVHRCAHYPRLVLLWISIQSRIERKGTTELAYNVVAP